MKTAMLISGGVDSSVALRLLQEQGHQLTAFYLKIWLEDELSFLGNCPWQEDLAYVQSVCAQAGVPLEVVSLQRAYWDKVVATTIAQIKQGLTPNPDIMCNQRVKFGSFYEKIGHEFDRIASGHYAQVGFADDRAYLYQSPDLIKDQTYFLSTLSQEQVAHALFPIGHLTKPEVRALAAQFDLPNKTRKDSQGICFLGKIKFYDFIKYHLGEQVGSIVEYETGTNLGTHQGVWFHTIGQRQGLGLAGGPWYVVQKSLQDNTLFVSKNYYEHDHLIALRDTLVVKDFHWISGRPTDKQNLGVKLRHGPHVYQASVKQVDDKLLIKLPAPDQGIAPGQYAVLYDGEFCLGGGMISQEKI